MTKIHNIELNSRPCGFEFYTDLLHPDKVEYPYVSILTLTCTKGKYSGEVIEAWYDTRNGIVLHAEVYTQFKGDKAKYRLTDEA